MLLDLPSVKMAKLNLIFNLLSFLVGGGLGHTQPCSKVTPNSFRSEITPGKLKGSYEIPGI